jgi:DNA-directed RNA polymerase specialized sigma24 family protein
MAYRVTGDLAESEHLAKETFIVAWQKLGALEDRTKLTSWLCGIVKNIARDTHRRWLSVLRNLSANPLCGLISKKSPYGQKTQPKSETP